MAKYEHPEGHFFEVDSFMVFVTRQCGETFIEGLDRDPEKGCFTIYVSGWDEIVCAKFSEEYLIAKAERSGDLSKGVTIECITDEEKHELEKLLEPIGFVYEACLFEDGVGKEKEGGVSLSEVVTNINRSRILNYKDWWSYFGDLIDKVFDGEAQICSVSEGEFEEGTESFDWLTYKCKKWLEESK